MMIKAIIFIFCGIKKLLQQFNENKLKFKMLFEFVTLNPKQIELTSSYMQIMFDV